MKHELRIMIFVIIALFMIHNSLFIIPAYAQVDGLGQSQIDPASPLYFLKSVREIVELKFAGTTRIRAYRQLEFATRRIREVKSLVQSGREDLIEPTLIRYSSHLQDLIGTANFSDEILAKQITESVILHMNVLQKIYGNVSYPRARMSIRTTINRLVEWDKESINKLNPYPLSKSYLVTSELTACRFLNKEASSSALNEVEKVVLSERAQKCLINQ